MKASKRCRNNIPGSVRLLPFYDALIGSGIKHVLTRHEQGAAHAANSYARVTGKTGVCVATSGPGATNLITGIATAYMDSIPMVAAGQVPTSMIGRCIPGGGYYRCHNSVWQAQLSCQGSKGTARIIGSIYHSFHRRPDRCL